mmetsp:Transcript_62038/g.110325  ORF Transcript_62038/g.110325 Transcript_62038/m.110325 type:complete len:260 (-) Transcript_62038:77-856(-)
MRFQPSSAISVGSVTAPEIATDSGAGEFVTHHTVNGVHQATSGLLLALASARELAAWPERCSSSCLACRELRRTKTNQAMSCNAATMRAASQAALSNFAKAAAGTPMPPSTAPSGSESRPASCLMSSSCLEFAHAARDRMASSHTKKPTSGAKTSSQFKKPKIAASSAFPKKRYPRSHRRILRDRAQAAAASSVASLAAVGSVVDVAGAFCAPDAVAACGRASGAGSADVLAAAAVPSASEAGRAVVMLALPPLIRAKR